MRVNFEKPEINGTRICSSWWPAAGTSEIWCQAQNLNFSFAPGMNNPHSSQFGTQTQTFGPGSGFQNTQNISFFGQGSVFSMLILLLRQSDATTNKQPGRIPKPPIFRLFWLSGSKHTRLFLEHIKFCSAVFLGRSERANSRPNSERCLTTSRSRQLSLRPG